MSGTTVLLALMLASARPGDGEPHLPGTEDFSVAANVVYAFEDGPVVLKMSLTYLGNRPVKLLDLRRNKIFVKNPKAWGRHWLYGMRGGGRRVPPPILTLNKGDRQEAYIFLHHMYVDLEPGKYPVSLLWSAPLAESKDKTVLKFKVDLQVTIRPTADGLKNTAEQLEKQLQDPTLDFSTLRFIVDVIDRTEHKEFVPVALRALETRHRLDGPLQFKTMDLIYHAHSNSKEATECLIRYLLSESNSGCGNVFAAWRARTAEWLTKEQRDRLVNAKDWWIRALIGVKWKDLVTDAEFKALLKEFKVTHRPIPAEDFQSLIPRLGSKEFSERVRASRDLVALGERALPALNEAMAKTTNPEIRLRLSEGIKSIQKIIPVKEQAILEYLGDPNLESPRAKQLLEVLAAAPKWTSIARGAYEQLHPKTLDY